MTRFELRQASGKDIDLAYAITRDAMRDYVEQTWGAWVEEEQREKHRVNFDPKSHRIVQLEGEEVGLLAVEEESENLWLVKIYLVERARGHGLGTALVQKVIDEAAEKAKGVRLRVLRVNVKARALYERLGFKVIGAEPERFFMVRTNSAA